MHRYFAVASSFAVVFGGTFWLLVEVARGQATGPGFAAGKNPRFRTVVTVSPEKVPNSTCGGLFNTASADLFSVPQGTVAELRMRSNTNGTFACLTVDGAPLRCNGSLGALCSYPLPPVVGPAKIALVFPGLVDQTSGCVKGLVDPATVELSGTLYKK